MPSLVSMCQPGGTFVPAAVRKSEKRRLSLGRSKLALATIVSAPIISRSNRGLSGSSTNRSCMSAGSSKTRESDSIGRRSATSSPRMSTAGCRGFPLSKRSKRRSASRSTVGARACHVSATRGKERNARLGVEHRDGEALAGARARETRDSRAGPSPRGRATRRFRWVSRLRPVRERRSSRGAWTTGPAAASIPPPARLRRSRRRDLLSPRRAPSAARAGAARGGLRATRLVANGDEQRRDVLAVLPRLGERGACAVRLNAFRRQIDADGVGVAVRALDPALRACLRDLHVLDHAPRVVEPAQERARTEQTTESAVAER